MIVLHANKSTEVWIDPNKITAFQRDIERGVTHVYTVEGADAARVDEDAPDVARLKAAWGNQRFGHADMSGSEVIGIKLEGGSVVAIYANTEVDTGA